VFPRDLPDPFRLARSQLEPALASAGFRLATECYDPEAFGSVYTEYVGRGRRLRLIWDGKDRWLWIEAGPAGEEHPSLADWHDLEREFEIASDRITPVDAQTAPARLANLKSALDAMLRGLTDWRKITSRSLVVPAPSALVPSTPWAPVPVRGPTSMKALHRSRGDPWNQRRPPL